MRLLCCIMLTVMLLFSLPYTYGGLSSDASAQIKYSVLYSTLVDDVFPGMDLVIEDVANDRSIDDFSDFAFINVAEKAFVKWLSLVNRIKHPNYRISENSMMDNLALQLKERPGFLHFAEVTFFRTNADIVFESVLNELWSPGVSNVQSMPGYPENDEFIIDGFEPKLNKHLFSWVVLELILLYLGWHSSYYEEVVTTIYPEIEKKVTHALLGFMCILDGDNQRNDDHIYSSPLINSEQGYADAPQFLVQRNTMYVNMPICDSALEVELSKRAKQLIQLAGGSFKLSSHPSMIYSTGDYVPGQVFAYGESAKKPLLSSFMGGYLHLLPLLYINYINRL